MFAKQMLTVLALGLIWGGGAMAQGLCFCPLCVLGQEKMYRQSSDAMAPGLPAGTCLRVRLGAGGVVPGAIISYRRDDGYDHLMRVVAVAGQRIAVVAGVPVIDGVSARQEPLADFEIPAGAGPQTRALAGCETGGGCTLARFRETLPDGASYEVLDAGPGRMTDDMAELTVPAGHVFVLGDHRDNAMDSRVGPELGGPGMVPLAWVVGAVVAPAAAP